MPAEGRAGFADELVRHVEDEDCGVSDGVGQGGIGNEVVGELDTGEVLYIFVQDVDEVGELLGGLAEGGVGIVVLGVFGHGDLFFVYPHLHLFFEQVGICACVLGDDFGDCGAPTAMLAAFNEAEKGCSTDQLPEPTTVTLCFLEFVESNLAMVNLVSGESLRCRSVGKCRTAGLRLQEEKLKASLCAQFIYSAQGIGAT